MEGSPPVVNQRDEGVCSWKRERKSAPRYAWEKSPQKRYVCEMCQSQTPGEKAGRQPAFSRVAGKVCRPFLQVLGSPVCREGEWKRREPMGASTGGSVMIHVGLKEKCLLGGRAVCSSFCKFLLEFSHVSCPTSSSSLKASSQHAYGTIFLG